MLTEVTLIVNTIRLAVDAFKMFSDNKNKRTRQDTALDLLKIHFILTDIVKDGLELLNSIEEDPAEKIRNLPPDEARLTLEKWDKIVRRQALRLVSLKEKLLEQDALSFIDSSLKTRLEELISSKFDRSDPLHRIGAELFFYSVFGHLHKERSLIDITRMIYHAKEGSRINVLEAREEIAKLNEALEGYKLACRKLIDKGEIRALTRKAREDTR